MRDQERIKKYLNGQMTSSEAADFIDWLTSQKSEDALDQTILEKWKKEPEDFKEWDQKTLAAKIESEINRRSGKKKKPAKQIFMDWRKVAASLILLVSIASIWILFEKTQIQAIRKPVAMISKSTPAGQKMTISLPDGTQVKLNADSRIEYPEQFSDTLRKVVLLGEAFFEVKENPAKPFIVEMGGLQAKVLGTSFNIKYTPETEPTAISLLTGKLLVGSTDQKLYLNPGEKAVYKPGDNSLIKEEWDYNNDLAWIDGILYFDDNTFSQIIDKLSDWYGVSFNIEGKPASQKHYTAAFENESLENVLINLGFSHKFRFEIHDKDVKIIF